MSAVEAKHVTMCMFVCALYVAMKCGFPPLEGVVTGLPDLPVTRIADALRLPTVKESFLLMLWA